MLYHEDHHIDYHCNAPRFRVHCQLCYGGGKDGRLSHLHADVDAGRHHTPGNMHSLAIRPAHLFLGHPPHPLATNFHTHTRS